MKSVIDGVKVIRASEAFVTANKVNAEYTETRQDLATIFAGIRRNSEYGYYKAIVKRPYRKQVENELLRCGYDVTYDEDKWIISWEHGYDS